MKEQCTAIVLAAGKGTRMGGSVAKQYLELGGKPLVVHALETFEASEIIDRIILMTDESHVDYCREEIVKKYDLKKVFYVGAGGAERYLSVWKALAFLAQKTGAEDGYVFIHDGARPFVTEDIIRRAYDAVLRWDACVVGMPVKDTIKLVDEQGYIKESPDRRLVWQAQTPQVFSMPLIYEGFQRQLREDCSCITDDAMVVEHQMGRKVHMVEGSYENIKITTPEDLTIAEKFLKKSVDIH